MISQNLLAFLVGWLIGSAIYRAIKDSSNRYWQFVRIGVR